MATYTKQHINDSGVAPNYTAVASSDAFEPSNDTWLHVKNGGASPVTVTIVTPKQYEGKAVGDAGGSVPNAEERIFGPFPPRLFGDPDTGLCTVNYSATASVTAGVFAL